MKYFKRGESVYAFELDGSQDEFIKEDMVELSNEEVDKILNPDKYLTEDEKYTKYINSLKPLTRRQFKLALLDVGLLDNINEHISTIEDEILRKKIQIEYEESTEFVRTSESVLKMCEILNIPNEEVDALWERALTY